MPKLSKAEKEDMQETGIVKKNVVTKKKNKNTVLGGKIQKKKKGAVKTDVATKKGIAEQMRIQNKVEKKTLKAGGKGIKRRRTGSVDEDDDEPKEKMLKKLQFAECYNCGQTGHMYRQCPEPKIRHRRPQSSEGKCYKCGSSKHLQKACSVESNSFDFAKCYVCGMTGHMYKDCPNENK